MHTMPLLKYSILFTSNCPQAEGGCPCTVTVLFVLLSSYLFPWVSNIPSPLIPLIGISAARWRCLVSQNLSETSFDCVPLKYFIHLWALSVFFTAYSPEYVVPCSENVKPNNLFWFIFMNARLPHMFDILHSIHSSCSCKRISLGRCNNGTMLPICQ